MSAGVLAFSEYTPTFINLGEILERWSLLYELMGEVRSKNTAYQSNRRVRHWQRTTFSWRQLCKGPRAKSRAHLAKRVCRRGIRRAKGEKTGGDPGESEKTARACNYIKIDQYSRSPHGIIGGSSVSEHSPFFPSLILNSYTHLLSLGMSGGHIFSNAHGTAMNGGTFYAADTVSE